MSECCYRGGRRAQEPGNLWWDQRNWVQEQREKFCECVLPWRQASASTGEMLCECVLSWGQASASVGEVLHVCVLPGRKCCVVCAVVEVGEHMHIFFLFCRMHGKIVVGLTWDLDPC